MAEPTSKIQDLDAGIVKCSSCSADIPMSSGAPLEVIPCPKCSSQVLIPLRIRDYWLLEPLGGGGMGSVYKAISEKDDKQYAVKVLPRSEKYNQDLVKALLHEGKSGSALGRHKNIIEIIDYGLDGDEYFLVTEFISGDRLDLMVDARKQIPEKEAVEIILQLIDAEMHIIKCGYLFRDLKPENIIITKNSEVKLFDYGLCLSLAEAAAHENVKDELDGSPFYIPPERIVGAPEGEYSEIYSLGMVLFYMLAGRTYYSLAEVNDLVTKHLTSLRVLSVGSFLKHCNPKIVAIIDRMIARKPVKRYHDFATLKNDFEQHYQLLKDSSKIKVLPPVMSARAIPKIKLDNKAAAYLVFFIVFLLLVLGIWGFFHYKKSSRARELRKIFTEQVSAKIGVPADVRAPRMSMDQVKKEVDESVKKRTDDKIAALPPFNETDTRNLIFNNLNLKSGTSSTMSVDEALKKMKADASAFAEREIARIDRNFNEEKELASLAEELKIPLPLKEPSAARKDVDAEFKTYVQKKVDEKYSAKDLYGQMNEISKKYGGYKKGDTIEIQDAVGLKVKGIYNGRAGNKVVIGDRQILTSDIPAPERWKFNEAECETNVQKMSEQLLDNYKKTKEKYRGEVESAERGEFYRKYGYMAATDGSVKTSKELVEEMLKKLKANFQDEIKKREKKIREDAEKNSNKSEYLKKNNFREIDGKWYNTNDAIKIYLAREKEKFDKARKAEIDNIRNETRKSVEKQIYADNGYVFYENKWQPAKELLDKLVEEKVREEIK